MTTIWLKSNQPDSVPVEVEYPSKKAVQLMVAGHRQVPAPTTDSAPAAPAVPATPVKLAPIPDPPSKAAPLPSLAQKIWLKPPHGGAAIEVEQLPNIVTPFLEQGYTEVPAP
jgi:hypothetical protein